MPSADVGKVPLRCTHCGREVRETVHTRSSYRVDYYALHTGEVEPVLVARREEADVATTVCRILRPYEVFTCVDCYAQPWVREEREHLFRPELGAGAPEAS